MSRPTPASSISRQADLHYAFQFGQDFAKTGEPAIQAEFAATFKDDAEAAQQFEQGVRHEQLKARTAHKPSSTAGRRPT